MGRRANVCFLLHMHQPQYVDPTSGKALLPWVRLHGARAYLDVARILADYPRVGMTVNFVPSLVAQLEAAANGAPDAWMEIADRPAGDWTADDRKFLTDKMFSIHGAQAIEPRPRYRELLEKRKAHVAFSDGDLRDATVLFYLSWLGFAARENDRELAELERRGRDFSHDDLKRVLDKQRAACGRVLPAWGKLAERGQVELSSSPYYHPIVPLLCDSDAAKRARPDLPLPDRYAWPEDAEIQIRRGVESHTRTFGAPPEGMWPPEGSVSPEAVALYAGAGVRWLATDEGNLWRSLDLSGRPHFRGDLYRAWRHQGVDLVFRDREISDRIGFAYAHGDSAAGAADLIARARSCAEQSTAPP